LAAFFCHYCKVRCDLRRSDLLLQFGDLLLYLLYLVLKVAHKLPALGVIGALLLRAVLLLLFLIVLLSCRGALLLRLPLSSALLLLGDRVDVKIKIAVERSHMVRRQLHYPRSRLVQQISVMRNKYHRAAKLLQRFLQYLFCRQVDVVRRLVEYQQVAVVQRHYRETQLCAFTAAKHRDRLENVLAAKQYRSQCLAYLAVRHLRKSPRYRLYRCVMRVK